eukprot:evm.model.scf_227.1 EVM.evm.TU.scf_227.1   scf_227:16056-21626(-)
MRAPLRLGQRAMRSLAGAGRRPPGAQPGRRDAIPPVVHGLRPALTRLGLLRMRRRGEEVLRRARRGAMFLEELLEEKRTKDLEAPPVDKIAFSKPLRIVKYPDPSLRAPCAAVNQPATGIKELAAEMFEIMYSDDGVGLAAPQVGVNIQMMVFNPEGHVGRGDPELEKVLINPRIVKFSKNTAVEEEGCLSFPQMFGDVERSTGIKVKARDVNGAKVELKLNGLAARIFQHEFDHLQGVLFFERMAPDIRAELLPRLVQWEEEFLKNNPGVPIQRVTTSSTESDANE